MEERGQTTTECLLLISVMVIGVVAAAYSFLPQLETGVRTLAEDVSMMLDVHRERPDYPGIPHPPRVAPPPDLATGAGTNGVRNREGIFVFPKDVLAHRAPMPKGYDIYEDENGAAHFIDMDAVY